MGKFASCNIREKSAPKTSLNSDTSYELRGFSKPFSGTRKDSQNILKVAIVTVQFLTAKVYRLKSAKVIDA